MNPLYSLVGLFGPFLVWPLELLVPFPYIVEELFKFCVVLLILRERHSYKEGLGMVMTSGMLFAFSETVLYMLKINLYGDIRLLFLRAFGTVLMHSITFSVIYTGTRKRGLFTFLGLASAMVIHFAYNLIV